MNETRSARAWTWGALAALIVTVGVYSSRILRKSESEVAALPMEMDLRDAVADSTEKSTPPVALIARGRPVAVSWFAAPESRHAELDRRLLSSRRRRAFVQTDSLQ